MAKRLYVGNLSYKTTSDRLFEVFSECGAITEVIVIRGKGFAFVEFQTEDPANNAIATLDGYEIDGREIRVEVANPRPDRRNGGGLPAKAGPHRARHDGERSSPLEVAPVGHLARRDGNAMQYRAQPWRPAAWPCASPFAGRPLRTLQLPADGSVERPKIQVITVEPIVIALKRGRSSDGSASGGVSLR